MLPASFINSSKFRFPKKYNAELNICWHLTDNWLETFAECQARNSLLYTKQQINSQLLVCQTCHSWLDLTPFVRRITFERYVDVFYCSHSSLSRFKMVGWYKSKGLLIRTILCLIDLESNHHEILAISQINFLPQDMENV